MASALFLLLLLLPAACMDLAKFDVKPFRIDLAQELDHLRAVLQTTRLPETALYPAAGLEFGIELDFLRDLRREWLDNFDWAEQEAALNEWDYSFVFLGELIIQREQTIPVHSHN
jgi:hypothetical protein